MSATASVVSKTPWHLWVVGVLALLWNASGAVTIMMAQAGMLPDISAEETAYYAAQPMWFVVVTDIALLGAIAAAIALLLRSRTAVWLFTISLTAIVITNAYDFATGMSSSFMNTGALVVTCLVIVLAILELVYARAMAKRGVLK